MTRRFGQSRPLELVVLLLVLGLGLFLRLWGSGFGLPHIYHPDEGFEVYRALRLAMGGFDFERVFKGGYYFLLFVEFGIYFVLQLLTGAVASVDDFALSFVSDPSPFWRIGRTTTAVMGTATVFLVWFQAKRMGHELAGLAAALFLAVSYRHVVDSHYVTVDVPMTLFAFWAVVLVVEDSAGRSRISWWGWPLIAAFAVLNKIPAIVLFAPYVLAALLRGGLRGEGGLISRRTIGPAVVAGGIYCLANPGIVLHFPDLVDEALAAVLGGEEAGEYAGVEQSTNLWRYYAVTVLRSQGLPMMLLALGGTVFGLVRRSREVLLHLSFLLSLYVLIAGAGSAHLYYARYVVPLLPGVCLLAGLALERIVRGVGLSTPTGRSAVAVLAALTVALGPALSSWGWSARQARTDTRTVTLEWMRENVPHGTRVLVEGNPEEESQLTVPLPNLRRNLRQMVDRLEGEDPGKARFLEYRIRAAKEPAYDLVTIRHFEPWIGLDQAVEQGVEYVVLRRDFFVEGVAGRGKHPSEAVATRYAFHRELETSDVAQRVLLLDADAEQRPGIDIEVWRLRAPAPAGAETADSARSPIG